MKKGERRRESGGGSRAESKARFCDFNAIHSLKPITHSFICMFFFVGVYEMVKGKG